MSSLRWSGATAAAKSSFGGRTRTRRAAKGAIEKAWDSPYAMRGQADSTRSSCARRSGGSTVPSETAGRRIARALPSEPEPNAAQLPGPPLASAQTSLTMLAGFGLALDPERGKYGSNRTSRYDQMLKYRERLFGGPRHAAPLLDRRLTWIGFVPAEARALWRRMADRHVSTNGDEFGVRAAEGIVDAIYSVAAWLREERLIPPDATRAPHNGGRPSKRSGLSERANGGRDRTARGIP